MRTINLNVERTEDLNVATVDIDFKNFDPHTGLEFYITYKNPSGSIIDRVVGSLTLSQWQNWAATESEEADYEYITDCVLSLVGLTKVVE